MLNQVILVGRVIEIKKVHDSIVLTIGIKRNYKDSTGIYKTDFIECIINNNIYNNIEVADLIGIKGRLESIKKEKSSFKTQVILEKFTFLSSRTMEEYEKKNNGK